jgi:hypothetical protein
MSSFKRQEAFVFRYEMISAYILSREIQQKMHKYAHLRLQPHALLRTTAATQKPSLLSARKQDRWEWGAYPWSAQVSSRTTLRSKSHDEPKTWKAFSMTWAV